MLVIVCFIQEGDLVDDDEDEEETKVGPHPDASTTLIFTNFQNNGKIVYFVLYFPF